MNCYIPISDIKAFCFSFLPEIEDARMYLLISDKKVIIVDPCISEEAISIIRAEKPDEVLVILTHEHYDHISGLNYVKQQFNCNVICSETCAELISDPRTNLSKYSYVKYTVSNDVLTDDQRRQLQPFSCTADRVFSNELVIPFARHSLRLKEMPGHSKGSICIELDDKVVFSGDNLIPGTPVVTCLPGGSKMDYGKYVLPYFNSLPKNMWVLPGHLDGFILCDILKTVDY